jgi:hypothetical protein
MGIDIASYDDSYVREYLVDFANNNLESFGDYILKTTAVF